MKKGVLDTTRYNRSNVLLSKSSIKFRRENTHFFALATIFKGRPPSQVPRGATVGRRSAAGGRAAARSRADCSRELSSALKSSSAGASAPRRGRCRLREPRPGTARGAPCRRRACVERRAQAAACGLSSSAVSFTYIPHCSSIALAALAAAHAMTARNKPSASSAACRESSEARKLHCGSICEPTTASRAVQSHAEVLGGRMQKMQRHTARVEHVLRGVRRASPEAGASHGEEQRP